ncbi:MAG: hypothetical protein JWP91_2179 [Fibrobacteres bacterium]|nr:hypothetical protein [Fibrobacterota bacterium]
MAGNDKIGGDDIKDPGLDKSRTTLFTALIVLLLGGYALWRITDRKHVREAHAIHISFTVAPDTIPVSAPSRFAIKVNGPKSAPLAGRPVHVVVTPLEKAQIISVTGPSGRDTAAISQQAWGRSDSTGNIYVTLRAVEPGKFTLSAGDTLAASAEGASVEFWAR